VGTWIVVASLVLSGGGPSQREMNEAACAKVKVEQRRLDEGLRELYGRTSKDPGLNARVRRAQEAWVKFKDLQLHALYGAPDPQAEYGSVWPMCNCVAEEELTKQRVTQVNRMLNPVEGDVCDWGR
jgi:uncharacterized protein YecT (DUF1311 family)